MTRSEDFQGGADSVRQPQFRSVQQQHNANFRPMSVLDLPGSLPNQNGMGSADLKRRMMGFFESAMGLSQTTYDSKLWLRSPQDTAQRSSRKREE